MQCPKNIVGPFLRINAEKKPKHGEKDILHTHGKCYRKIERQIKLPFSCDREKVNSTFENGMLTITFQKIDEMNKKKIPVHVVKRDEHSGGDSSCKKKVTKTTRKVKV